MLKNNRKTLRSILKKSVPVLLGVIVGYLLYYYIVMEVVVLFASSSAYLFVSILSLIGCLVGCTIIFNLLINQKINKKLFILIGITYFLVLFAVLFMRRTIGREFILNPLTSLLETFSGWQMGAQSIMNLLIFVPIGYCVRNFTYKKLLVFSIVLPLLIELCQVALMRGFFDIFDILLYFAGIHIGYFIFQRWKLTIE